MLGAGTLALVEQLAIALGLYGSFFYWGYLQEELTVTRFSLEAQGGSNAKNGGGKQHHFDNIFILQLVQCVLSLVVSTIILAVASSSVSGGRGAPADGSFLSANSRKKKDGDYSSMLWATTFCGIVGPQFGYASMQHLSFPTVLTVKMCKMIPVIFVGMFWHRIRYGYVKVVNAFCITCGVVGFVLLAKKNHEGSAGPSNSWFGVVLCGINIFFDGYLNSTQGLLMKSYGTGPFLLMQQMAVSTMKAILALLIMLECIFYVVGATMEDGEADSLLAGFALLGLKPELSSTWIIFQQVPRIAVIVVQMGVLNAIGSAFIFIGISRLGAVTLVALTLTRKVGSVFISIFYHEHEMLPMQWISLAFVVVGVMFDCWLNLSEKLSSSKTLDKKKAEMGAQPKNLKAGEPSSPTISRYYR